jgi:hypothetical protein
MTTGGCGDHYPVTAAGRLVAFGLMLGGIALLGTVTAASTIQDARVEQALSIMIKIQAESADALVAILDDHDEMIRMGANAAMHASTWDNTAAATAGVSTGAPGLPQLIKSDPVCRDFGKQVVLRLEYGSSYEPRRPPPRQSWLGASPDAMLQLKKLDRSIQHRRCHRSRAWCAWLDWRPEVVVLPPLGPSASGCPSVPHAQIAYVVDLVRHDEPWSRWVEGLGRLAL